MPGTPAGRVMCLYCFTIGGKGLGILRMGFEHPINIKREEMIVQKNSEYNLFHCIGYTPESYFMTPISGFSNFREIIWLMTSHPAMIG